MASFLQEKAPRGLVLNGFKFSEDGYATALKNISFHLQVYLREPLSQSTYEALKNAANGTPDRWQRVMLDASIATGKFPLVVYSPRPAVTFSAASSSATPKRDRAEARSAEGCGNKKTKISEHNNKPRTKNRQEEQPEAIRRNPKRTCRK
jgi:hypothetical protein